MTGNPHHQPVLLRESLELLGPKSGETVLDLTLGLGGHAAKFLEKTGPTGRLIAVDADEENLAVAKAALENISGTKEFHHRNFSSINSSWIAPVDIIFADLGVSSPHFDDPSRGFSFRMNAPLDLRYDRTSGKSAAEMLRDMREEEMFRMFADFGELQGSARLAKALWKERVSVQETQDLKKVVEDVFGYKAPNVLPQVFQAIRIAVNDELGALRALLEKGPLLLKVGGRMGVISYHSLEDRLVKNRFRELSEAKKDPQTGAEIAPASFRVMTKKGITPTEAEIHENPRARSGRLRILERTH